MTSDRDLYTEISPGELWRIYSSGEGLFRGGGTDSSPELVRPNGPRARDFDMAWDSVEQAMMVMPSRASGLSFADAAERLQRIGIKGRVWVLPRGTMLPEGLTFVYETRDHPMLTVTRRMSAVELMIKLAAVAKLMRSTDTYITRRR